MKFITASAWLRKKRKKEWYKYFAWYPVKIDDEIYVWFEYVQRRITGLNNSDDIFSATYEYKLLTKE